MAFITFHDDIANFVFKELLWKQTHEELKRLSLAYENNVKKNNVLLVCFTILCLFSIYLNYDIVPRF